MKRAKNGVVYYCFKCKSFFVDGEKITEEQAQKISTDFISVPCDECIENLNKKYNKYFDRVLDETFAPFIHHQ